MLKKKILLMLSVFLCSNLISNAYFCYLDSSDINYIKIGKIKKETDDMINGCIFKYTILEKTKLSKDEWFNRASFTAFGKLIYLRHNYLPLKIRKISYFDKVGLAPNYIMALYTKDLENKGTAFNIKNLTIEVLTDNGSFFYGFSDLNGFVKTFDYSKDSKTIKETKDPRVSCALIDLLNILQLHIKSQKLWINVHTYQGKFQLKVRDKNYKII